MKLVTVIMFLSLMQVSAKSFSQRITIKENKVTVERIIKELRKQAGYDLLLATSDIKITSVVQGNFNNSTVSEVMDKILSGTGLAYAIEDKTIIIKVKTDSDKTSSVGLVDARITGKVKDKSGQPMPGVAIREKGTTNVVSTNEQGDYRISVKDDAVLAFSFIGYKTVEMPTKGKNNIDVTLEEDQSQLKEVNIVSTGYQNIDKKLFTGSSSLVKAEDAQRNGVPDVSRMLEGQVAGVSVQNVSGTFGAAPKIRVRGATSLSGDNKPLWVIDGIILEDVVNISNEQLSTGDANTLVGSSVAGLNPDDIESFTILKDAAATAKYGARAMNGVIVINTKKGRVTQGALKINYTGNYTTYLKPSYSQFDILNSSDQMSVLVELFNKGYFQHANAMASSTGGVFQKMYQQLYNYNEATDTYLLRNDGPSRSQFLQRYASANTDWFDVLFKNSLLQEHSINISSGTEKFQTYASTSYLHDSGQTLGNNVDRFTGNFRANFKMNDKISGELLTSGSIRDQRAPGTFERTSDPVLGTYSREFDINPYSYELNTSRAITPYQEDGSLEYFTRNFAPFNILNELENNYLKLGQIDLKIQGSLSYQVIPSLKYTVSGAYRFVKTERQHYILENSNTSLAYKSATGANTIGSNRYLYANPDDLARLPSVVLPEGGFYNINGDHLKNLYFRQDLQFDKKFNENHHLNLFGSMETRYTNRQTQRFNGVGYQYENGGIVNPNYLYFKWKQETVEPYYGMGYTYDRFVGFLSTLAYSYKDKYTLNSSVRVDGSNKMGKSRTARWLPTWNVSGKWNIDQEAFWPESKVVTSAILRGSYGLVGNIGNATNSAPVFYNQVSRRPFIEEKETITYISSLANSALTWEKTKDLNIATDIGFINNRVQLTLEYYRRNIFDLIGSMNTSGIGGQYTKVANYGQMKARGFEFTLAGNVIQKSDFRWRTNLNFAYNTNEITALEINPSIWTLVSAEGGPLKGYAHRGLFSIQFAGLDHNYGYPKYIDPSGNVNAYVDPRGTGVTTLKYEGPVDAPYNGGFYNNFKYKNFSLSALLTFSAGNFVRLMPTYSATYPDFYAMSKDMLNRWTMPGDEAFTNVPALIDPLTSGFFITNGGGSVIDSRYAYNVYNYSTERVAKGDFIRLKQVSLNYEMPKNIMSKLKIANATVALVGNNIALLYSDKKLNGQDPEFFGTGGVATPIPNQYTLSLKVGF